MAKKISMVRIREDRAEMLREKAIELTIKKKESFIGLMVRAFLVLASCWAIIEIGLRLKV